MWQRLHELLLAELHAAGKLDWSRAVIDLERHDLRQLAQMPWREPARGYHDRTVNDRMPRQRNSQLSAY